MSYNTDSPNLSQVNNFTDSYAPNVLHWRKGDIVLHHSDSKHPRMFMIVTGYTRDGLCKTQYLDKRRSRKVWKNDLKNLLNPSDFDLKGNEDADEFENIRRWNYYHPVGTTVTVTSADGGFTAKTRSMAWLASGSLGLVLLEGKAGGWLLKFLDVVPANGGQS